MRSIEEIIRVNGGDNTPGLDTHNLTGRAFPEGVEPEWTPFDREDDFENWLDDHAEPFITDEVLSYETWLGSLDCE